MVVDAAQTGVVSNNATPQTKTFVNFIILPRWKSGFIWGRGRVVLEAKQSRKEVKDSAGHKPSAGSAESRNPVGSHPDEELRSLLQFAVHSRAEICPAKPMKTQKGAPECAKFCTVDGSRRPFEAHRVKIAAR